MPGLPKPISSALLAICVAMSPVVAGCGGDDEPSSVASLVPPDAPFFVEATIRPEGDRAEAIVELSSKIGGVDDLDRYIVEFIDSGLALQGGDLTFAEDIEPWLGEQGAIFVRSLEPSAFAGGMADAAYIVEVTDTEAAASFVDALPENAEGVELEERTYDGTDYLADGESVVGLVGDFMVAGTEDSFKSAVDASTGEALADDDEFSDSVGDLDDSAIAEMWLDLGIVLDAAGEGSGVDGAQIDAARAALGPLLEEPVAMSLAATTDTVTLDTSAAGGAGLNGDTELLEGLPAQAWFAVAAADAGETIQETLSGLGSLGAQLGDPTLDPEAITGQIEAATGLDVEDDVLSWIGDVAFYVAGTSEAEFEAGAIVESTDDAAAADAVSAGRVAFEQAAGREAGPPRLENAEEGFSAISPLGQGLEVALREGQLVAALGGPSPAEDTVEPDESLGDSDSFEAAADALGGEYAASLFLGLQDALVVAEKGDDDGSPDYDAIRPYTEALDYMIFGTATDDDRELSRIVVGVTE